MAARINIRLNGVDGAFRELSNEIEQLSADELRDRSLQLADNLRQATPVDSGRARASWNVNQTGAAYDAGEDTVPPDLVATEPDTVYITNGTDYIDELNDGDSQQAGPRFIEQETLDVFGAQTGTIVRRRDT